MFIKQLRFTLMPTLTCLSYGCTPEHAYTRGSHADTDLQAHRQLYQTNIYKYSPTYSKHLKYRSILLTVTMMIKLAITVIIIHTFTIIHDMIYHELWELYIYIHTYIHTCVCIYRYIRIHTYVCMYVCTYIYIYMYMYMYMYVCVYIYIYTYTHVYIHCDISRNIEHTPDWHVFPVSRPDTYWIYIYIYIYVWTIYIYIYIHTHTIQYYHT